MENSNKIKTSYSLIIVFFIAILAAFTTLNLVEFLKGSEKDGRMLGLNELDTIQDDAVTVWGGLQAVLGKKQAFGTTKYEDVTILNNGYSTLADPDPKSEAAINGINKAKAIAEELNADFIYVASPSKQYSDELLPEGVVCYANAKYDNVLEMLKSSGINYIDMRGEILERAKMSGNLDEEWFSYFYKSDHHWRNKGAFLAYSLICNDLKGLGYSINEEYLNENNYIKKNYYNIFLGTHGRMAGPLYTGLDDYELWLPAFETSFDYNAINMGIEKTGTFEDTIVYYENLAKYSYDYYAYYTYFNEDYDFIEVKNNLNKEGPHIVIVRDSSAVAVSAFLINQCSELDMVDLRYVKAGVSAIDYIKDKKPDVIIYMFSPGYLGVENAVVLR